MTIDALTDQLKRVLNQYATKFSIDTSADWLVMKLQEEVGELTRSYLTMKGQTREANETEGKAKEALGAEIADVVAIAMLIADINGIDIEANLSRKWLDWLG